MLGGEDIIRKLVRGIEENFQLLVQRILKAKTRCADVLKAQNQEITYKERTYILKSKESIMSRKSSEVRLIYLQVLKHGQRFG